MMDWVIIRPLILIVCLFNLYLNSITTIKEGKKRDQQRNYENKNEHTIPM